MNDRPTEANLLRAVEELRVSHGEALGAVEAEIRRLQQLMPSGSVAPQPSRETLINQTKASNNVVAAHSVARRRAAELKDHNLIGGTRIASILELGRIKGDARRAGLNTELELPLLVPFFGSGGLCVVGDTPAADSLIYGLYREVIQETTHRPLKILTYDPNHAGPFRPQHSHDVEETYSIELHARDKGLDELLDELTAFVENAGALLPGKHKDVVRHARQSGTYAGPLMLVCFHDFPVGVTEVQYRRLLSLQQQGPACGLAFVFHIRETNSLPSWARIADLQQYGEVFRIKSSGRVSWARKPRLKLEIPTVTAQSVVSLVGR